jgi:phage terminase Nu1 subunit (DNA packaging protein)
MGSNKRVLPADSMGGPARPRNINLCKFSYVISFPENNIPMELKIQAMAGLLGLSTRRITQLHGEGIAIKTGAGVFDAEATIQNYIRHISAKASNQAATLDLNAERARLAREQADGQSMKNAQLRGELVDVEAVAQTWESIVAEVRSAMLAVPGRLRRRAGAALDAAAISLVDHEIREALSALAEPDNDQAARPHEGEAATEDQTVEMD